MKEKKQSANWNIAATHYLTSGFVIPVVAAIILGIPLALLVAATKSALLAMVGNYVIWFFALWLGVIYSSKYIAKTYIVKDASKIVRLATIYFVVLGTLVRLNKTDKGITIDIVVDFIFFLVIAYAYYYFSKKYLHDTPAEEIQPVTSA